MKLIWQDEAVEDLQTIYEYIARDSALYAAEYIEKIMGHESAIIRFPNLGRIVPEYGDPHIREVFEGNYRIIYRVHEDKDRIDVLTVVHGAQELKDDIGNQ